MYVYMNVSKVRYVRSFIWRNYKTYKCMYIYLSIYIWKSSKQIFEAKYYRENVFLTLFTCSLKCSRLNYETEFTPETH